MVNTQTNVVDNVCNWDGTNRWSPPSGHLMVQSDTANSGDIYDPSSKTFTRPPEVVDEEVS